MNAATTSCNVCFSSECRGCHVPQVVLGAGSPVSAAETSSSSFELLERPGQHAGSSGPSGLSDIVLSDRSGKQGESGSSDSENQRHPVSAGTAYRRAKKRGNLRLGHCPSPSVGRLAFEDIQSPAREFDSYSQGIRPSLVSSFGELPAANLLHLARRLYVCGQDSTGTRWISDLILNIPIERLASFGQNRKDFPFNPVSAISLHPDGNNKTFHVHCYHLCRYNQSRCDCQFVKHVKEEARIGTNNGHGDTITHCNRRIRPGPIIHGWQFTPEHCVRWVLYFCEPPRRFVHLEINRTSYLSLVCGLENLSRSQPGASGMRSAGPMASSSCPHEGSRGVLQRLDQNGEDCCGTGRAPGTVDSGSQRDECNARLPGKVAKKLNERRYLVSQIEDFLAVPIQACVDCESWINHEHLSIYDKSDPEFKQAITQLQRKYALLSYEDLILVHKSAKTPHYLKRQFINQPVDGFYMDVEESTDTMVKLLEYQLGKRWYLEFIRAHNIFNRGATKQNTVHICGPPNCGKTYFADWASSFYINVGQIGNFNRYSNFPLNDAPNRRILVWNEPNVEPSAFDTVKMLTGGDPLPANVKYQSGAVIDKTPVIITTNTPLFAEEDMVWKSRCIFWDFKPAEMLKEITRKPHPAAYIYVESKAQDLAAADDYTDFRCLGEIEQQEAISEFRRLHPTHPTPVADQLTNDPGEDDLEEYMPTEYFKDHYSMQ